MSTKLVLIAVLLAAVALAQPAVNAPLLPQYNFIAGSGSDAVVGVVMAADYAFTADGKGVWAMNSSMPANSEKPFWDALPGVTQMWSWCGNWTNASTCHVHVIAGSGVVLYKMNETTIWRAASFWAQNATFDIISQSGSYNPSYMYPAILPKADNIGAFFVVGTRNTSSVPSGTYLPSVVYAFDLMDLSIVWQTPVNSDTTNFATMNCTEFVWIMTQNTTGFNSDTVVRKLYMNNGTMTEWSYDTSFSNTVQNIGVMNGQFIVLSAGGYLNFAWYNGTQIDYHSVPGCGSMPFTPTLLNNTWYAICGSNVYMYDATTLQRKTTFSANSNILCGTVHEWNMDFVLGSGRRVYVGNSSGISLLVELPDTVNGYSSYCSGARFNYVSPTMKGMPMNITDILHLSFTSADAGSVIAMNYRTGEVIAQAVSNVAPIGPAMIDYKEHRLYVASTQGNVLQGYDFVPWVNVTSFAVGLTSTYSTEMSLAYNATNRSTYYVARYGLYTIDHMGNYAQLDTFSYSYSSLQPMIIGQYLVIIDSYNDVVRIYDSVKGGATTSVSVCSVDTEAQPVAYGSKLIVFCSSYSTTANVIDLSATTPTAAEIAGSEYRTQNSAVVVDKVLVITTGTSTVSGFDWTKDTYTTATFALKMATSGFYNVQSTLAVFNNKAYFVARPYSTTTVTSNENTVYSVTSTGALATVGKLMMQTSSDSKVLIIKSGGVFGGGIMYIIGMTNISAYTTNWDMMFNYQSTSSISLNLLNPVVLDTGAVCFYSSDNFTVVGGFKGGLAWQYPVSGVQPYAVVSDNVTIYFTDGRYIIGANTYTGGVASLSTYGSGSLRGFAVAFGENSTTVVGVTDNEVIFGNQVISMPSATTYFPGSGSAPSGNGSFGDDEKSKAWIAGVVIGVLVVIAIVIFVAKRGGSAKTDDNYVPMNPATQV
jgi:hypothetical protein